MKSILALAVLAGLVVGIAYGNSTAFYGWAPHKEFVYRWESQVLTGIPNLRSQYAGVKLSSDVIVQTFADYSLRIKFQNPRFIVVNEELQVSEGRPQIPKAHQEVPEVIRQALTTPFVAHLKRGVVEALFVERSEPVVVTNIKKALLTQLQLDLTASRKREVTVVQQDNNSVEKNELPKPIEDRSYFTTEESSIVGDCQTSYTMHPLPKHQAVELERRIQAAERLLAEEGVIAGETSEGEQACRGKEYFEITKTKHFDNCKERPTYQSIRGMKTNCDFSKAECKELMTQMSASRYIVCGSRKDFIIREAQTDNEILTNPLGWNVTPEKMTLSARVTIMLLKVKSSGFQPLPKPQNPVEKRGLIYEFPRKNLWSTHESREVIPRQETDKRGYQPILPMPDMNSGSSLVPAFIPIDELKQKIAAEMQKVVKEIFQSPESCSSKSDIAGTIHAIAQSLRPRNYQELQQIERSIMDAIQQHSDRQVAEELWTDILAMTGSNACITMIKKKLEQRQLGLVQAARVLQSALRNVKTPTQELLREMVQLVKSLKPTQQELEQGNWEQQQRRVLYNTGLIQLANLIQHACIDPTARTTQFPVRTYGLFCTRESEVVKAEFIPYLISQLQKAQTDSERLMYIAALGKVGDKDVVVPLAKVIEQQKSPLVRSVAVYSLKRVAKLQPAIVRPLLLKMIDNPAENTEVRIAAVSILPWTQPSTAQLQKIAVRSWFEPSKQVASFIHSTLKSLTKTKVPELLAVGIKAKGIESLVKPFQYGIQFSHSIHTQKFVEYLRVVSSVETSYVNTAKALLPARVSLSNQLYGGVWQIDGLTYSIYTNGMEQLIEKALKHFRYRDNESSEEVRQELNEIDEKLNIKSKEQKEEKAQSFIRYSMLGFHRAFPVDKKIYDNLIERVSEELRSSPEIFSGGKHFNLTYANYAIKVRVLLPSMAGFPVLIRRNLPVVFGVRGNFAVKTQELFRGETKMEGSIVPVINGKLQSSMGIISPFTKKFVGAGVEAALHYSVPVAFRAEINVRKGQFALTVKNPEQVQQKQFHAIHAFVKPFTVVKSLERLAPLSKAESFKEILSGKQLKSFELPLGRSVGIDAKLKVQADYKQLDFPFVWEKLSQQGPLSLPSLSFMAVSARAASLEIIYNPAASETKEIDARFHYIHGKKLTESELPEVSHPSREDIVEGKEEEIKQLCRERHQEQSTEVRLCEEKMVENLLSRRESHKNVNKMLEKIASGRVHGLNLEANFHSGPGGRKNAIKSQILIGSEDKEREVKSIFEIKFQTPEKPAYEVQAEINTELPEMPYRWNVQELIQQSLKMESKIKIRYGKASGEKKEVDIEAVLSKSEQQKEAVRRSPELKKCEEEISKGKELSSVCIETRHQAASVDKIQLKVRVPESWKKSQLLNKAEAYAKSYLWSVMYEEAEFKQQEQSDKLVYELDVLVNRTGDVAQAWIKSPYTKLHFKNLTLPSQVRGFFPISLRNGIPNRILQKITRSQAPASCRVEEQEISTFDNKTYRYQMSKCEHLLFKDCQKKGSQQINVAVLAKQSASSQAHKDVKIVSGNNIVLLKWKGSSEVEVIVNNKVESVPAGTTYKKYSQQQQKLELAIHRTGGDKVISVSNPIEGMQVFYDGKKIEVVAPQLFHNRACGLCGDLNGENTADLKSDKECIMTHSRFAAYSFMTKRNGDQECSIPEADREAYNRDQEECLKTEHISTRLVQLARKLVENKIQPISTKHVIEILENNVCISKSMIKVCGKGQKPIKVRQLELSFACLTRGYSRTHQILRRAEAGEEIFQVRDMPTEFSKKHLEAVICERDGSGGSESREEEREEREEETGSGRRLNSRREEEKERKEELLENGRRLNNREEEELTSDMSCRKNTQKAGRWQDNLKPSDRIREMCHSGKTEYHGSEGKIELRNTNRFDCMRAVQYAQQEERQQRGSTWTLWSDFTCGRMTIVIKN